MFRSYSVRLYLRSHEVEDITERKEVAIKKAQIDFHNRRRMERFILLNRYNDFLLTIFDYRVDHNNYNGDELDLKDFDDGWNGGGGIIQLHVQIFKEMKVKFEVLMRKCSNQKQSTNSSNLEPSSSILLQLPSLQNRLQDRKTHLSEVIHAINQQLLFLTKLYIKSRAVTKFKFIKMRENNERWKSIRYAIDFVDSKSSSIQQYDDDKNTDNAFSSPGTSFIMNDWLTQERDLLIQSLVECDKVQESLLDFECKRFENELNILLSSNDICTFMIGWIRNIEMWEAERFGMQQMIMTCRRKQGGCNNEEKEKRFSAVEANMYLQLIDDNQMKLNRARKIVLPQICEEAGDFYHEKERGMDQEVCFKRSNDGVRDTSLPVAMMQLEATINNFHKLPTAENYFWSIMEWMEFFSKNYQSLLSFSAEQISEVVDYGEKAGNHLKALQQYVYNRREILLEDRIVEGVPVNHGNFTKLKWNVFGTSVESITNSVRRKVNLQLLAASRISNQKIVPVLKQVTRRRGDPELMMMMTVVKKTMNKQNSTNVVGVVSLKFTVGKIETDAFTAKNNHNEAKGKSFYQKRIDLGNHVETALWVQISSKNSNFITNMYWGHSGDEEESDDAKKEGIDFVRHGNLPCIIYTERDPTKDQVISSIQIAYANTSEPSILEKDYSMIPTRLSEYGLADAHLWVSYADRSSNNTIIDLSRMKNQLAEYEVMLSNRPNDILLKGLVTEMERRIELTKRKEKEQRGLSNDHIGYISEFLALNEKDLNGFKKAFQKIDTARNGIIAVNEIISFFQEPITMVPLVQDCIIISLGGGKLINKSLCFAEFIRAMGTLAMFSFLEMTKCIFCSIDKAGYGCITQKDFYDLLCILHPKKEIGIASRSLRDTAIPESLTYAFFKDLASKFPKLLFPMFRFQLSIRNLCLGTKWWDRKMRRFAFAKEMVLKEQIQMRE